MKTRTVTKERVNPDYYERALTRRLKLADALERKHLDFIGDVSDDITDLYKKINSCYSPLKGMRV